MWMCLRAKGVSSSLKKSSLIFSFIIGIEKTTAIEPSFCSRTYCSAESHHNFGVMLGLFCSTYLVTK